MNYRQFAVTFGIALLSLTSLAAAAALRVGDPAPPLAGSKWLHGSPITQFEKGKIYVVDFWATWCVPCKESIPLLTELAKANPDVTFIGANISERDVSAVEPFVQMMGSKMTYRVMMDDLSKDADGEMSRTWMTAAGMPGIPTVFVVDAQGAIAFIGDPEEVGPVITNLRAGTHDMAAARAKADQVAAKYEEMMLTRGLYRKQVRPLLKEKNYDQAMIAIDDLLKAHPREKAFLLNAKFTALFKAAKYDGAYQAADELADASNDKPAPLNALAWTIVDSADTAHRDLDRAMRYATRANELTENKSPPVLDTLARVYFDSGKVDKAIEIQTRAVDLAEGEMKAELNKSLDRYRAARAG